MSPANLAGVLGLVAGIACIVLARFTADRVDPFGDRLWPFPVALLSYGVVAGVLLVFGVLPWL